jgi:invasion protein IalB
MRQELFQQDGGQRVLSVAIRVDAATDEAALTMITPFGLDVTGQVTIRDSDILIADAPFATCVPAGCIVQAQLSADALAKMQAGEAATVSFPTRGGASFDVEVSLRGFTAAFERLRGL